MRASSVNESTHLRERAAEMRESSKELKDNNTAAVIMRLADLYDRLADRAETRGNRAALADETKEGVPPIRASELRRSDSPIPTKEVMTLRKRAIVPQSQVRDGEIHGFHGRRRPDANHRKPSVERTREYPTAKEVEDLMAAARKSSRYGHRDATM